VGPERQVELATLAKEVLPRLTPRGYIVVEEGLGPPSLPVSAVGLLCLPKPPQGYGLDSLAILALLLVPLLPGAVGAALEDLVAGLLQRMSPRLAARCSLQAQIHIRCPIQLISNPDQRYRIPRAVHLRKTRVPHRSVWNNRRARGRDLWDEPRT
jgi:hypothetical protein